MIAKPRTMRLADFYHALWREQALADEDTAERAADADFAFDVQPRVVNLQNMFHDRQSQPGAARFARAARRHAIKTLADTRQMFGRNSHAGIGDSKARASIAGGAPRNVDASARRRVAHRIGNEIGKRAVQVIR